VADLLDGLNDGPSETVDLLDNMTDEGAPAWVPEEPGEGIQGRLVSVSQGTGDYGSYPVWVVDLGDDNKVRVNGFGTVLSREMQDANAEPGDTVAVKFFGDKEIQNGKWKGKMYKHYKVAVAKGK